MPQELAVQGEPLDCRIARNAHFGGEERNSWGRWLVADQLLRSTVVAAAWSSCEPQATFANVPAGGTRPPSLASSGCTRPGHGIAAESISGGDCRRTRGIDRSPLVHRLVVETAALRLGHAIELIRARIRGLSSARPAAQSSNLASACRIWLSMNSLVASASPPITVTTAGFFGHCKPLMSLPRAVRKSLS